MHVPASRRQNIHPQTCAKDPCQLKCGKYEIMHRAQSQIQEIQMCTMKIYSRKLVREMNSEVQSLASRQPAGRADTLRLAVLLP